MSSSVDEKARLLIDTAIKPIVLSELEELAQTFENPPTTLEQKWRPGLKLAAQLTRKRIALLGSRSAQDAEQRKAVDDDFMRRLHAWVVGLC